MTKNSKRHNNNKALVDAEKRYDLEEAITILKDATNAKFEESIDVAINLGIDGKLSDQNVRGSAILPNGNGKNMREWIYVLDHCEALIYLMKKGKLGEQYNIGSGIVLNNIKIINMLKRKYNKISYKKSNSKIKFITDRPGHDLRYALNSSKIKKLGWKPKTNLNDGLKYTIEWYLKN